jgi:hypothetical protein
MIVVKRERMTIDLSSINSWIWLVLGLVILFVILRYFFHVVVKIVHFVLSFFWHGCAVAVVLFVLFLILRAIGVL